MLNANSIIFHIPHDERNWEAVGQALFIPLNARTPLLLV